MMAVLISAVRSRRHRRYRAATRKKRSVALLAQLRSFRSWGVGWSIVIVFLSITEALAICLVEV